MNTLFGLAESGQTATPRLTRRDILDMISDTCKHGLIAGGCVRDYVFELLKIEGPPTKDYDVFYPLRGRDKLQEDLDSLLTLAGVGVSGEIVSPHANKVEHLVVSGEDHEDSAEWVRPAAPKAGVTWCPPQTLTVRMTDGTDVQIQFIQSTIDFVSADDLLKTFDFTLNMFYFDPSTRKPLGFTFVRAHEPFLTSEIKHRELSWHNGRPTCCDAWLAAWRGELCRPCQGTVSPNSRQATILLHRMFRFADKIKHCCIHQPSLKSLCQQVLA